VLYFDQKFTLLHETRHPKPKQTEHADNIPKTRRSQSYHGESSKCRSLMISVYFVEQDTRVSSTDGRDFVSSGNSGMLLCVNGSKR
jgi:hypothetical protein